MLVLSRHEDEQITIGPNAEIVITIVRILDGKVRVGIDAARGTPVHRREVFEQIRRERLAGQDGGDVA